MVTTTAPGRDGPGHQDRHKAGLVVETVGG
jgi:hypothetical protein